LLKRLPASEWMNAKAAHLLNRAGFSHPNPSHSHFRSTEIWQTATDSETFPRQGWIGRCFNNACPGAGPAVGVTIGRQTPQALASQSGKCVSLGNPHTCRIQPPSALTAGGCVAASCTLAFPVSPPGVAP